MAVDRKKFRTCAQTSFCRRHRFGDSSKLYRYRLNRESIQFVCGGGGDGVGVGVGVGGDGSSGQRDSPMSEKEETLNSDLSENDVDESKGSRSGGGGGVWKTLVNWGFGSGDNNNSGGSSIDPYVRGPSPCFTAILENTAEETSTGFAEEELNLSVALHSNGVARIRILERYDDQKNRRRAYNSGKPRWTSDELILNLSEMKPATHVQFIDSSSQSLSSLIQKVFPSSNVRQNLHMDNFLALSYHADDAPNHPQHTKFWLLLRLDPFAAYVLRGHGSSLQHILTLGDTGLMHFEIRRTKHDQQQQQQQQQQQHAKAPPAHNNIQQHQDRHGGKEVVGYWEDGLAIYADGTREQRQQDQAPQTPQTALHRQLHKSTAHDNDDDDDDDQQQQGTQPNFDRHDMWEESFASHKDTKPNGPMSVGMDITFPYTTHLYGLPEHASSLQLRTTRGHNAHYSDPYRLYNLDVFEYELDETMALYGEVPLIISHAKNLGTAGVFWFNPTETFVDIEYDHTSQHKSSTTHWISESGVIDIFILPGPSPKQIYSQYATLTGRMPLPPMFTLGYHQCRWNYRDQADVYNVHANFEKYDYPYDVLWLDIEHTDGKRYFTWDKGLFPTPIDMQKKLDSQARNMVTIIDPHIKVDDNYYIYKEANNLGLYVKDNTGNNNFEGWCWPGQSSYLDFTSQKVRSWWADQFSYDKYQGSTPSLYTWNDMNEPSVFNGPEVSMQKDLLNLDGVEHREWHNLYGILFQRATSDGLLRRNEGHDIRPFVLSRSFFASSQRYGAIWTGDNECHWSHLAISMPMLLSLNTAALSFVGADVGGFFGNPDAELMTRWMQAGAYQPFFRGHAHHDSKRREPWVFGDETLVRLRRAAMARYALLPYWYTVFREAGVTGMPVMRAMWMQYPQTADLFSVDDQYLIGSDLMIKPVTASQVTQSTVLFPTAHCWYDVDTKQLISPSHTDDESISTLSLKSDIDKIPVFQRGGSIIPRKLRLRRSSRLMISDPYTLYVAMPDEAAAAKTTPLLASGSLYVDDENTLAYTRGEYATSYWTIQRNDSGYVFDCRVGWGSAWDTPSFSSNRTVNPVSRMVERIVIMGFTHVGGAPKDMVVVKNGKEGASVEFEYHDSMSILVIRMPNVSVLEDWKLKFIL